MYFLHFGTLLSHPSPDPCVGGVRDCMQVPLAGCGGLAKMLPPLLDIRLSGDAMMSHFRALRGVQHVVVSVSMPEAQQREPVDICCESCSTPRLLSLSPALPQPYPPNLN